MSNSIELPFAFDGEGNKVAACDGVTGEAYKCPACDDNLGSRRDHLRKGMPVRRCFVHRGLSDSCPSFAPESWQHWYAKYLICERINSGDDIKAVRQCSVCDGYSPISIPKMDSAKDERRLANGRIPDVTGFFSGEPVFLVEVLHTHASKDHELPWMEVRAAEAVEDPLTWVSTRRAECEGCTQRIKAQVETAQRRLAEVEARALARGKRWEEAQQAKKISVVPGGEAEAEEHRWKVMFPSPGKGLLKI